MYLPVVRVENEIASLFFVEFVRVAARSLCSTLSLAEVSCCFAFALSDDSASPSPPFPTADNVRKITGSLFPFCQCRLSVVLF